MELSKEQQTWVSDFQHPYYTNDPLCCDLGIAGGELIYERCQVKKNDNINDMTYEQLITWKNYTEEQILDMEYGPTDARWASFKKPYESGGITKTCKISAIVYIRQKYNLRKSLEIYQEQDARAKFAARETKKEEKIILEKQRTEQILKMKEIEKEKILKEENRLKKIKSDKEILEYVDNFIPKTPLEKISYAQYIHTKLLTGKVNGISSQLDYHVSR